MAIFQGLGSFIVFKEITIIEKSFDDFTSVSAKRITQPEFKPFRAMGRFLSNALLGYFEEFFGFVIFFTKCFFVEFFLASMASPFSDL